MLVGCSQKHMVGSLGSPTYASLKERGLRDKGEVTLVDGEGFYTQGYTDQNGNATLNFNIDDISGNEIELTVTKFGNKPYMETIAITNQYVPYVDQNDILNQIECPIGLKSISSKKPSEIAISIIGRLLEFRSNLNNISTNNKHNLIKINE